MTAATVLAVAVIASILASLAIFILGIMIDRGKRNTEKNRALAMSMIRIAVVSTTLSWLVSAALAICVLAGYV